MFIYQKAVAAEASQPEIPTLELWNLNFSDGSQKNKMKKQEKNKIH